MPSTNPRTKKTFLETIRSWNYTDVFEQYLVLSSLCQSRDFLIRVKGGDRGSYRRRLWYLRGQILRHYVRNIINFPVIFFKLLLPSFLTGTPNIWANLKSILTRAEFHPLRMAIVSWLFFSYLLFQGGVYYWHHAEPVYTASYNWTQTTWTTSSTDTAIHPTDQTGWAKYSSVDSYITTGSALSLAGLASSITHNDSGDFSGGTYSNTAVGSGGVFMITLGRSSASFVETSVDGAFTGASGADDVDVDNDGDMDLVGSAYVYGSNQLVKYTNNGSQSFTKASLATLSQPIKVIGLDVDTDGDDDFVSAGEITTISLYRNNGSGTFSATTMKTLDDGYFVDFDMADLDDDGDYDLLATQDVYQDKIFWVRNTNFSFGNEAIIDETNIGGVNGMIVHDIDDDGDKDVVIAAATVGDVIWYANNGSESFTKTTIDASLSSASQVVAGDFDGDSDEDVAAIGGASLVWYANNGSESFTKTTIDASLTSSVELLANDVDGDGDIDLVGGGSGGLIKWYMNDGTGSFSAVSVDTNFTVSQLSLGDVNSDGATDIIAAGGSSVAWYRQQVAYVASGSYTSAVLDTLENSAFNTVSWTASTSAQTTVSVKVRTSNSSDMTGATAFSSCTAITNDQDISSNGCVTDGHRYVQYQLTFTTASESATPQFTSISINYSPPTQTLVSSAYNTNDSVNVLNKIQWSESLPSGTDVKFQLRTAPDNGGVPGTWTSWYGPSGDNTYYTDPTGAETVYATNGDGTDDQWIQYRVILSTTDAASVPSVQDVTVTYVVNAPPEFESTVLASQTESGPVTITYSIRDPDTETGSVTPNYVTPSFQYSTNNGSTWNTITGGLSSGATTTKSVAQVGYTNYTATWNGQQVDGIYASQTKIRVTINDGEAANSTASSTSAAFALDLKDPVPGSPAIMVSATTTPATVRISATDNSALEMKISLNADMSGSAWESYRTSATMPLATDPDTVYVQFRDAYGNESEIESATTPETPLSLIIRDVSNEESGEYQLFLAWKVSTVPLVDFSQYQIWTSTDGSTYTLLSSQDSRALNYVVQFNLTEGSTYYYKVATVDTQGNVSYFSSSVSDSPNGQGGTDTTAPTISSVSSEVLSQSATITWNTDELSNSTVSYSNSPGSFVNTVGATSMVDNASGVGRHSVTLNNLTPGATYYYRVSSQDPAGNTHTLSSGDYGYSFTTVAGPSISNVVVRSVENDSAVIEWETDSSSASTVYYSTQSSMSGATEIGNSSQVTSHSLTLTGLSTGQKYYFYVKSDTSVDNNGGQYYSFTTASDVTPPVISSLSAVVVTDVAAVIRWNTDELADSFVGFGTSTGSYTSSSIHDSSMGLDHSVVLQGLEPDTEYFLYAVSVDGSGNIATSTEETFTTLETLSEESSVQARENVALQAGRADGGGSSNSSRSVPPDTINPTIIGVEVGGITTSTVTIKWETGEDSDSIVQYGRSEKYGYIAGGFATAKQHVVSIDSLFAGTTYHFRPTSQDASGNRAYGLDMTFTTEALPVEEKEEKKSNSEDVQSVTEQDKKESFVAVPTQQESELLLAAVDKALDIVGRSKEGMSIPAMAEQKLADKIRSLAQSLPPPILSGKPTLDIGPSNVSVSWTTDKQANALVALATDSEFQASGTYTQVVGDPETYGTSHRVSVFGLKPNTLYHYRIRSKTPASALTESSDFVFTTPQEELTIINSSVSVKSSNEALFRWTTNVPTDSELTVVTLNESGQVVGTPKRVSTQAMSLVHELSYQDFEPGVQYDVTISGKDVGGFVASKVIHNFITEDNNQPPVISQVQTDSAISPGKEGNIQTVISWVTNEPGTTRIYYQKGFGNSGELKEKTVLDPSYVKKHIVVITSFEPNAVYQFKAESLDAAGNIGLSKTFTILTPRQKEGVFQVIFKNAEDAFGWVRVFNK